MPEPFSARSVSRVSNCGTSAMCSMTSSGMPKSARIVPPHALQRGQLEHHRDHALGQGVGQALVDAQRELRRVGGLGELVQHLARALGAGVGQVEGLAVEVGLVGDVVHRLRDPVDRHDVGVAHLRADEREPLRQPVARLLDRLEEVVGAVDLVHLAGLGVADDDRGPVDAPRHGGRLVADELLGLELGAVVGGRQLLALVEHVLAEQALVGAGGGDRGHVVQAAHLQRVGQVDRVARAADVQGLVALVVGGHVVDRGEVEEVVDLALQLAELLVGDPEARLGEVADHRLDAVGLTPAGDQVVQALPGALAHEHVDVAVALSSCSTRCRPMKPVAPVTK